MRHWVCLFDDWIILSFFSNPLSLHRPQPLVSPSICSAFPHPYTKFCVVIQLSLSVHCGSVLWCSLVEASFERSLDFVLLVSFVEALMAVNDDSSLLEHKCPLSSPLLRRKAPFSSFCWLDSKGLYRLRPRHGQLQPNTFFSSVLSQKRETFGLSDKFSIPVNEGWHICNEEKHTMSG